MAKTLKRVSHKASRRIRRKRTVKGKVALKGFGRLYVDARIVKSASKTIRVKAAWDAEAKVWYIEDSSLPGLHIEASTPIELYNKLPGAIEDLLEGSGEREVPFEFIAPGHATIPA